MQLSRMLLMLSAALYTTDTIGEEQTQTPSNLHEVNVWGKSLDSRDANYTSPNSILNPEDMQSINVATTEDLVKFEPSLVIRRRFIGDSNGTLGVRGSNMFQTARSMVFADGVPLHYLLQSRWSGAPRWTMVSASEIKKIEVLYGPYSAEYSGNAMGGVVLIETGIPSEKELHANISGFNQTFNAYGFDDNLPGYKGFVSFADKINNFSYYLSFNRLDNEAQPQTFRGSAITSSEQDSNVNGSILGSDARLRDTNNDGQANEVETLAFYGDTGVVNTETNNYKIKLGYEFAKWQALLNIAYEDRESTNTGNSYITNNQNQTLWSSSNAIEHGYQFSFNSRGIAQSKLNRESASYGLRIKGDLSPSSELELNINQFDILRDTNKSSGLHPNDAEFNNSGQITEYDNSGWQTFEAKIVSHDIGLDGLKITSGLRHENYELNLAVFNTSNYQQGIKEDLDNRSGGKTSIDAIYSQASMDFSDRWNAALGLRYETFKSSGGYYGDENETTNTPNNHYKKWSPKLSIGFFPNVDWLVRYSLAKAFRFPITEELYSQYQAYNTVSIANPQLQPEDGTHQNLMFERRLLHGYARLNIFHETIKDAIESQTDSRTGVRTFNAIDQTKAQGIELIINKGNVLDTPLDLRFNVTYTDAKIVDNPAQPEYEGNSYPRIPRWRANLLANYQMNKDWKISSNLQYASNAYGRLENDDTVEGVYGAQDKYTRIGLKTSYQIDQHVNTSFGIDNVTNEVAYVAHPWPGRTFYVDLSYNL